MLKDIYKEEELNALSESELELLQTLNETVQGLDEDKDEDPICVFEYIEDKEKNVINEGDAKKFADLASVKAGGEDKVTVSVNPTEMSIDAAAIKAEAKELGLKIDHLDEDFLEVTGEWSAVKSLLTKGKHSGDVLLKEDTADLSEFEQTLVESGFDASFKEKATVAFQAELDKRVEAIEESYETKYAESADQIDAYMQSIVEEWLTQNTLAFDASVRTDLAESFMGSIKDVFTENYIEVPEAKTDLFSELEAERDALKESCADATKANELLVEGVKTLRQEKLLAEACVGLASTQTIKLQELAEKLDYENDSQYSSKLTTLKEFYFKTSDTSLINEDLDDEEEIEIETIVEEAEIVPQENRQMASILNALSRASAMDKVSNVNAPAS